ncbi:MAG: hypothetical protein R3326_04445 [Gemmatimonadota bacterium]|nr:hypothetical protein [Gemmatimonadota bacterium]
MKIFASLPRRLRPTIALLVVAGSIAHAIPPSASGSPPPPPVADRFAPPSDDRAIEIALAALEAIRADWALARYAAADRVRGRLNLRGTGTGMDVGVTASAVVDRPNRRWRLDASGDVGPLTLAVSPRRALLYVASLEQHAVRPPGTLASALLAANPAARVDAMRANLRDGYAALRFEGEELVGGAAAWRLEESPEPGVTASYWIDQRTSLPLRVVLDRPGRNDVRVEFGYGAGPRPTRVAAYVEGQRDVQVVASPAYDGAGRARHVHVDATVAGGGSYSIDVMLDWSPRIAPGFFDFAPPAASQAVSFSQLLQGVVFSAAGKLGGLVSAFLGGR